MAAPADDMLLQQIADYVMDPGRARAPLAVETARLCLMDTLGCGFMALGYPACTKLLGPVVPGATLPGCGPVNGSAMLRPQPRRSSASTR